MERKKQTNQPTAPIESLGFWGFIELEEFAQDWDDLDLDVEGDLTDLQLQIMGAPTQPPVMSGTGKLRFSPRSWNIGKGGALRVCYAVYERHRLVLLVTAYGKSDQDNLSAAEKAGIKKYLERFGALLDQSRQKRLEK